MDKIVSVIDNQEKYLMGISYDAWNSTELEKNLFSVWAGQAFSLLGSELVQFSLIW